MNCKAIARLLIFMAALAGLHTTALAATPPSPERLSVAVTEADIEAIVSAVGGNEVETFSLFKGCILRENLKVEPAVESRLAQANALVWTGYLNESAAITTSLQNGKSAPPRWIDVSKGAVRVNVPASTCFGYVDPKAMMGDPFFWLNPHNGSVVARNVADGLGALRPEKRAYFLANANAFKVSLDKDSARWEEELRPLTALRVFSAQCGWHNFSKIGGPALVVCKAPTGSLPTPRDLLDRVRQMKAQIIILDPNTPLEYGNIFREQSDLRVIEVASSIGDLPGAHSYSALFENFIRALQAAK
jgi:ABC-type Zn uptake system ZnuABC Zn-binding protein ZnuA